MFKSVSLGWALACLTVLCPSVHTVLYAQADPQHYRFNTGQSIQPIYQGWSHNPDESFELHFGYLNRNYVEELHVPIGPNNRIIPDDPDRGQPTYFYPRRHGRVFSVTVPNDWGDRELIWEVTVGDETYRAVGWLQPEWEIVANPPARGFLPLEDQTNQKPSLTLSVPSSVALVDTLAMVVTFGDDGLPERQTQSRTRPPVLPTLAPTTDGPTIPINVPQLLPENRKQPLRIEVAGLNITVTQWRGPTGVALEQDGDATDNEASLLVHFVEPGNYLFRVRVSDGMETVTEEVAVSVRED